VAAAIARVQERESTGVHVTVAAAAAAAATEHLLKTLLRARETHAQMHTARQAEPVGVDTCEGDSIFSCGRAARGLSRCVALCHGSEAHGAVAAVLARGTHTSSDNSGPSGTLHENVCARRRSAGRSPFRANVGFGEECT
jgi:hypothetical protein